MGSMPDVWWNKDTTKFSKKNVAPGPVENCNGI